MFLTVIFRCTTFARIKIKSIIAWFNRSITSKIKSPGIDGFTVEFYKFFWNDIKIPLVKCLNESLDNGKFSVSQRQGLITCIPKEGKPKHFLKNWRPITLEC